MTRQHIVFLTGAGISAESGLSTFRGEDGAYWFNYINGKDTYEECFNKLSLNEQIEQIKAFMDEVFNLIYGLFEKSQTN